jgi:hypothetical protein
LSTIANFYNFCISGNGVCNKDGYNERPTRGCWGFKKGTSVGS